MNLGPMLLKMFGLHQGTLAVLSYQQVRQYLHNMSRLVGKQTMWFPNRSDINRPVQLQKQARRMKFWS